MTSPVDFSTGDIWRAASDKSPSTEEVKRAIEGPGKDFGKSIYYDDGGDIKLPLDRLENPVCL
jgi:hypothetical protein